MSRPLHTEGAAHQQLRLGVQAVLGEQLARFDDRRAQPALVQVLTRLLEPSITTTFGAAAQQGNDARPNPGRQAEFAYVKDHVGNPLINAFNHFKRIAAACLRHEASGTLQQCQRRWVELDVLAQVEPTFHQRPRALPVAGLG